MPAGRPTIVAVDGPAGAGKSTASRLLARQLRFTFVDTGAIYRSVALAAVRAGIAPGNDAGLSSLLQKIRIRFEAVADSAGIIEVQRVLLRTEERAEEDVSDAIRTSENSLAASAYSSRQVVRDALLGLQRNLALATGERGAVLEGRDIGTVIFPDADVKFFVTASPEERARRRLEELRTRGNDGSSNISSYEEVLAEQRQRDREDSERPIAPLFAAADAIRIDTTGMNLHQVVKAMVNYVGESLSGHAV